MHTIHTILQATPLFAGFSPEEIQFLLPYLEVWVSRYERGDVLISVGRESNHIGVVLSGQIEAVKYTRGGEEFLVSRMGPGGVFSDVLSGGMGKSPVTVRATSECRVMFLPVRVLFGIPPAPQQEGHRRLLANLVAVLSAKYFALDSRVDLLLIHGLRRRLAAYLLDTAPAQEGQPFDIPFDRYQLAAYLGCERSALSREISAMIQEGWITAQRSQFCILDRQALRRLF